MNDLAEFRRIFTALTGNAPFPWQEAIYSLLLKGEPPKSCNIPTGLGKTAVIPTWLIALANNPKAVPRRLVYVVNRRTVVDQATRETEHLREQLQKAELKGLVRQLQGLCAADKGSEDGPLAISTLRGQFADNGEWCADPTRPAVIVGTVDMIGSRLLFSGYGCGPNKRPMHAGFLGQDSLIVHDEAHLEPAFQQLLSAIRDEQSGGRTKDFRPLRLMELTATSRGQDEGFALTKEERTLPATMPDRLTKPVHYVWKRLRASKKIRLHENGDPKKLADEIADCALKFKESEQAVLVFLRKVEDVEKVVVRLRKTKQEVQQLTGTLRGLERDSMATGCPIFARFLKPPKPDADEKQRWRIEPKRGTVYLVCTSAGEVGVDLSADHLICDLSTFESMAQRFGRVNRFGDRDDTEIHVVHPGEFAEDDEIDQRRKRTLSLLRRLKSDGSPAALADLDADARLAAFSPTPPILATSDILFDAWALTTIRGELPGRPTVEPFLHGVEEDEARETCVAWREEVWELRREFADEQDRKQFEEYAAELLDDYPLKPHELLRDNTFRKNSGIRDKLATLAKGGVDLPAWIQDPDGSIVVTTLSEIAAPAIAGRTLILPPQAGGLAISNGRSAGLLDAQARYQPDCRNVYDVSDQWNDQKGPLRKRIWQGEGAPRGMVLEREIRFDDPSDDAEASRVWQWFVRKSETPTERCQQAVALACHQQRVTAVAERTAKRLMLPNDIVAAVAFAAGAHDLGKDRQSWQHSIGNDWYPGEIYAKSGALRDGRVLRFRGYYKDYRHEFGSLLDVMNSEKDFRAAWEDLSRDAQDLALHLIAAHHGWARPHFPAARAFDPESPQSLWAEASREVPRRFARLQRAYGRWGLAYLESLLRAADWAASAELSQVLTEAEEVSQ